MVISRIPKNVSDSSKVYKPRSTISPKVILVCFDRPFYEFPLKTPRVQVHSSRRTSHTRLRIRHCSFHDLLTKSRPVPPSFLALLRPLKTSPITHLSLLSAVVDVRKARRTSLNLVHHLVPANHHHHQNARKVGHLKHVTKKNEPSMNAGNRRKCWVSRGRRGDRGSFPVTWFER